MRMVIGLGNPGERYKNTRHNAGFWLIDSLEGLNLPETILVKPQKFMNRSGLEVKKAVKKWKVQSLRDLYIAHDDLDIELGKYKISWAKGPKAHNGLKSIYDQLGTKEFWHIRIGIGGNRQTGVSGEEYVLANWQPEEKKKLREVIVGLGWELELRFETLQAKTKQI